jgi:hypothetical protein
MRLRLARKLHNRDQVEVRVAPNTWVIGYVLGESHEENGQLNIPVEVEGHGYMVVKHTDIR